MKRSELFFSFLLVPFDFLMIVLAGLSAYYIRYADFFQELRPVTFDLDVSLYFESVFIVALVWVFIFAISGLYSIKSARKLVRELYRVVLACSTGFVLIVILIFISRELFDSRFIILAGYILAIIYISVARIAIRMIQRNLFRKGVGVRNVVIIGSSKTSEILIKNFSSSPISGYKVVKRLYNFNLETENDLKEFIKTKDVDEVIQSDPGLSKAEILRLYDFADEYHITFKYAADLLGTKVLKTEVNEIAGVPVVEIKKTPLDGWGRIIKRICDIVFSFLLIVFFSPLIIISIVITKLDSAGPVFYKNERVGQVGKLFNLFKFRSMLIKYCTGKEYSSKSAEDYERELIKKQNSKEGPLYKIENDPRITRWGKFIRRWSIDELPQFFNVFLGSMSLVGPRPHQPKEVSQYELHHKKVLTIKPGITGMAQISGRSDLSFEEEVKLDTYYIENWTILLDLTILLRTPWAVLKNRKVE